MKKIILSIGIVFSILILVRTVMPFLFEKEYSENEFVILGVLKLILLIGTLFVLKREDMINWEYTFKNLIITSIVSLLLIYLSLQHVFSKINELKLKVSNYDHFCYAFNCLTTGLFEEFFFRILVFAYVCKIVSQRFEGDYYKPILWTSFLFAIVHITGFLTGQIDFESVINQMMFAFLIGIILQSVLFRFNNIYLGSTLHALINYNGMINQKLFKIESHSVDGSFFDEFIQTITTFITIGLFVVLPIFYFSLKNRNNYLIKRQ